MSAQKPANISFAKQILRKIIVSKKREEIPMTFLLSLYWNKRFFREKSKWGPAKATNSFPIGQYW